MLLNAAQQAPLYKVCIYAAPGRGKTHLGATAPDPLILLFERHGFETVRTASKMAGRPMPPVLWVRSVAQLARIRTILASGARNPIELMMLDDVIISEVDIELLGTTRGELITGLPYVRPKTVVVDSVTEACEMIASSVDEHGGLETKNGLTYRKLKAWGPIADKCTAMIRAFRDLPYHVILLALLEERDLGSDDAPDLRIRPAVPGRNLWKPLLASVNAAGLLCMQRAKGGVVRWVQFVTPDHIATKAAEPLRDREPPDAAAWFYAMEHGVRISGKPERAVSEGDLPSLDDDEEDEAAETENE